MSATPIAEIARSILQDFDALRDLSPADNLSDVEDQFGRFRIFASNVGVFAAGHASLDYRLRSSEDVQEVALRLLRSLQWFLHQAIETIKTASGTLHIPSSNLDDGSHEGASSALSSYASNDTSEASTAATLATLDTTDQRLGPHQLNGVERTIDQLGRMLWMIRTPSRGLRHSHAPGFKLRDNEGNDYEATFEAAAMQLVGHRCPQATIDVKVKLAKSIVMRRKRFMYRKRHQEKLSYDAVEAHTTGIADANPRQFTPSPSFAGTILLNPLPDPGLKAVRENALSATSASAFTQRRFRPEDIAGGQSIISTVFRDDMASDFQPPPAPKVTGARKEVECPYCYILLPVKETQPAQWKRHFLGDLDPYVCLSPHCAESNMMFSEVNGWINHMQSEHARQWTCSARSHTRKQLFPSQQAFESHMRSEHEGAFAENHLMMLARQAEVPGVAFVSCPLCGFVPDESSKNPPNDLVLHIAAHLRSLAMFSLPNEDWTEDAESHATISHHANGSADDHDLAIGRTPSITSDSEEDAALRASMSSSSLLLEDPFDTPDVDRDDHEYEWDFIERTYYQGHDRDPTLQTFLKELYLKSSPSPSRLTIRGPRLPCQNIPVARNSDFFGREHALTKMTAALSPAATALSREAGDQMIGSNPRTFVVHGPGGMGKTSVITEFIYRHLAEFDAVFWVHGEDRSKLAQDFNTIALKLGLVADDAADARDQVYTRELVRRWLVDPLKDLQDPDSERASWLLVYDGVEDARLLNDYWPYDGPGSILITSRNPFTWAASYSYSLFPLTVDEASRYLLKLTNRHVEAESAADLREVCQKLGGLPLALAQMAGIITGRNMSFREFVEAYNERESRQQMLQAKIVTPDQSIRYEHSIASVWPLETLRHGLIMLNVMSMLDSDGVVERLFTDNLDLVDLPGLPRTMTEFQLAKTELLALSIITAERTSSSLFVHRLVQDVARMRLDTQQFRDTFMCCVRLVANLWPYESFTWRHSINRWSICETLFPHVSKLREIAFQYQLLPSQDDLEGDSMFARLLTDAGFYQHERGRSAEARWFNDMAEQTCKKWVKQLVESDPHDEGNLEQIRKLNANLSEITHNRGCITLETNADARGYFKEFNADMLKEYQASPELRKTDMRLAISWNELGNARMMDMRWQDGLDCYQRSIETMRQLQDFKPIMLSLPLCNLGLTHWLMGNTDAAIEALTRGLKDRQEAFGLNDRISFITGRFLHALGNVMATLGRQEQSLDYHRRALFFYKSTLGNGHHRTADLFVKVAEHSMRMGQYDNALALLDHALKAYTDRDAGDYEMAYLPEKARAIYKRSRVLRWQGKLGEADGELEEAARLREDVLGTKDAPEPESLTDGDFDDLVAFWSR